MTRTTEHTAKSLCEDFGQCVRNNDPDFAADIIEYAETLDREREELVEMLKDARETLSGYRHLLPKSIKDSRTFRHLNTLACIDKLLSRLEGK